MSPRKSSTSSGKPERLRSRYLALEVAGVTLSPRALESLLKSTLPPRAGLPGPRLIRYSAGRGLVEVSHLQASEARARWNSTVRLPAGEVRLATRRSWGTLRKGKLWLRAGSA